MSTSNESPLRGYGPKPTSRSGKVLTWLVIGLALTAVVAAAGWIAYLNYQESKIYGEMSAETRAAFEKWYGEKLTIPAETTAVQPYSAETMAALQEFKNQWQQHLPTVQHFENNWAPEDKDAGSTASIQADEISPEMIQRLAPDVAAAKPLLDSFKSVVARPDYTISVWQSGDMKIASTVTYRALRSTMRMIEIEAHNKLPAQPDEAIRTAETLVAAAQMDTYSTIVLQSIAMVILDRGLSVYETVLEQTSDANIRKMITDTLVRYRPKVVAPLETNLDPLVVDQISISTAARRSGIKAEFDGKTGHEISLQSFYAWYQYLEQIDASGMSAKELEHLRDARATAKAQIDAMSAHDHSWKARLTNRIEKLNAAVLYQLPREPFARAKANYQEVINRYDKLT